MLLVVVFGHIVEYDFVKVHYVVTSVVCGGRGAFAKCLSQRRWCFARAGNISQLWFGLVWDYATIGYLSIVIGVLICCLCMFCVVSMRQYRKLWSKGWCIPYWGGQECWTFDEQSTVMS